MGAVSVRRVRIQISTEHFRRLPLRHGCRTLPALLLSDGRHIPPAATPTLPTYSPKSSPWPALEAFLPSLERALASRSPNLQPSVTEASSSQPVPINFDPAWDASETHRFQKTPSKTCLKRRVMRLQKASPTKQVPSARAFASSSSSRGSPTCTCFSCISAAGIDQSVEQTMQ